MTENIQWSRGAVLILAADKKGQMVIVREKDRENPKWKFPGGGIEEGEYPLDAAIRELRQETGISLTGQDLRFVFKVPKINHNLYVYLGRISSWSNLVAIGEDSGETMVAHYKKIFMMDDFLRDHHIILKRLIARRGTGILH